MNTLISEEEDPSGLSVGTYSVKVTDSKGCSVTHTNLVTDFDDITFDNELEDLISLVPNPTSGKVLLNLNLNGYYNVQVRVYNNLGKEINAMPSKNLQIESFELDEFQKLTITNNLRILSNVLWENSEKK